MPAAGWETSTSGPVRSSQSGTTSPPPLRDGSCSSIWPSPLRAADLASRVPLLAMRERMARGRGRGVGLGGPGRASIAPRPVGCFSGVLTEVSGQGAGQTASAVGQQPRPRGAAAWAGPRGSARSLRRSRAHLDVELSSEVATPPTGRGAGDARPEHRTPWPRPMPRALRRHGPGMPQCCSQRRSTVPVEAADYRQGPRAGVTPH